MPLNLLSLSTTLLYARRVLELGCGTGLVGICLAKMLYAEKESEKLNIHDINSHTPTIADTSFSSSTSSSSSSSPLSSSSFNSSTANVAVPSPSSTFPPVILTDGFQHIVELAHRNVKLNNLEEHVMCRSLEWGSHQHIQDLICEQVETSGSSGFDYILGSGIP